MARLGSIPRLAVPPISGRRPAGVAQAVLCSLLLVLLVAPARAQTTGATLTGSVRDAEGRPVAGAVVLARSDATGVTRTAVSDARGRYRLAALTPGHWVVVAHPEKGSPSPAQEVILGLQVRLEIDLVVGPGHHEEITVEATTPLVDAGRTVRELRVGREEVDHLPINARNVTDLALLDSSVQSSPPGTLYGEREAVFLVNGQSGRANSYLVDGLGNNDMTSGTTLNANLSPQVIREFVVMTNQFAPEFGRASGGVLNIVTERGTNEPHFEVFVQGANAELNQPGEFLSSLPRPVGRLDVTRRLQTGFKWGGPLLQDKAFLFAAFEHQEIDRVVPYTGIDRDDVPGGWDIAPDKDENIFVRTDFNLGRSNFLMVRLLGDERVTELLNVGGPRTPESGFRVQERDLQLAASLTTVISPDLLNEARVLLGTSAFDQFAVSARPGVLRPSGVFGGNDLNRQLRDEERLQVVDNLTWRRGAHTYKFGFDLSRSRTTVRARFNPNGRFLYETDLPFEPGDCGDLLISNVAGHFSAGFDKLDPIACPGIPGVDDDGDGRIDEPGIIGTYPLAFIFIDGQPNAVLNDTSIGLFAQDSWETTPRLQLDYGLRYDLSTFRLPSAARVDSSIANGGAGRDENNLAPRLGFAYRLGQAGRSVLRGGAGMFYDKIVLGFPATASITGGTRIGLQFPQGFTFEFTERELEEAGIDAVLASLQFPEEFVLRFSTGTEMQTPYSVQYNLGIERAVGERGAFRIGATRVLGYHQVLLKDLNPAIGSSPLGIPIHRDPTVGSIAAFVTEGRSWYTGVDAAWVWRGRDRRYSASYTWSRATDLGFDPLKSGISLPPDSDNIFAERGRADADRRHRLVLYGEAGLPFMGLRAAGVAQISSELPFNVTTGEDGNADGVLAERPAGIGRNTGDDTPLGPVNSLRLDAGLPPVDRLSAASFAQVDLRVWKPFSLRDGRTHAEFFVQVFNVFNRFNGGPVEGNLLSRRFGQPIGRLGPPRTFELGLKLGF